MTAARNNEGKPHMSELAWFDLEWLADHCTKGRAKYPDVDGKPNWRIGGKPDEEYTDAIHRHWKRHVQGEFLDGETGTPHLAAIAWNALACLTNNHPYPERTPVPPRENSREPSKSWIWDFNRLHFGTDVESPELQPGSFR